jgi:TatD DNase family protein
MDRAHEIARNLRNDGVEFIVEIGCEDCEIEYAAEFAEKYDNVYCAVGIHPMRAQQYCAEIEQKILNLSGHKKLVAIGEVGLDYYHMTSTREVQIDVFKKQIELSHKMKLPLVVHSREAFADTLATLTEMKHLLVSGILIHCCSYNAEEVKALSSQLDCYFAFGGATTYKSAEAIVSGLKSAPRDRILIETDCPYLAPGSLRGGVNEPKYTRLIASFIATALDLTQAEVEQLTLINTKNFFKLAI